MAKNRLNQPLLIYMYGLPGSGKTFVARQLSALLGMAHINSEQIRQMITQTPHYEKEEQRTVRYLMNYMTERFLDAGMGVIYDVSANRVGERRALREMAAKHNAKDLMIWVQIDIDSAWARQEARDKRTFDDKFSEELDQKTFEQITQIMQNPQDEKPLVLSGKHLFNSQKNTIIRRLFEMGVLKEDAFEQKIANPGLVNLVPRTVNDPSHPDYTRRNVVIR
jgi:predicted kinase